MPRFALNGINDDTVVVCARATAFQILRRVCAAPRCSFQVQLLGLLESPAEDDLDVCVNYVYGWHRLIHNSLNCTDYSNHYMLGRERTARPTNPLDYSAFSKNVINCHDVDAAESEIWRHL